MRSTEQNEKIETLACAILKKRGIERAEATYDEFASAATIAAEAVGAGHEDLASVLGYASLPKGFDLNPDDAPMIRTLAKLANDGRFVADLSVDEETFLREAIRAEEARDASGTAAVQATDTRTIVAETIHGEAYCRGCGMHIADYGCVCE